MSAGVVCPHPPCCLSNSVILDAKVDDVPSPAQHRSREFDISGEGSLLVATTITMLLTIIKLLKLKVVIWLKHLWRPELERDR